MRKTLSIEDLDRLLDRAARRPEEFSHRIQLLIDTLECQSIDLEIADPTSWRRADRNGGKKRATSFLSQFHNDVSSIQIMDRNEEARLTRRIEFARARLVRLDGGRPEGARGPRGAQAARRARELHALRTEMVERNLYLVEINAERYARLGTSRVDLIQEGSMSLFRAVDGFDWRRGLLFRTYAVHWLNQAYRNYIYNFGHTVRVPVYIQKAMKHINRATVSLGDPNASYEEIAESAQLSPKVVRTAITTSRRSFSIDNATDDGDEGGRLRDLLVAAEPEGGYDASIEDVSLTSGIRRAMESLSDRERFVVQQRFGLECDEEHTLADVAGNLGVSVERVRQIQMRALTKLDSPRLRREMDPFLN